MLGLRGGGTSPPGGDVCNTCECKPIPVPDIAVPGWETESICALGILGKNAFGDGKASKGSALADGYGKAVESTPYFTDSLAFARMTLSYWHSLVDGLYHVDFLDYAIARGFFRVSIPAEATECKLCTNDLYGNWFTTGAAESDASENPAWAYEVYGRIEVVETPVAAAEWDFDACDASATKLGSVTVDTYSYRGSANRPADASPPSFEIKLTGWRAGYDYYLQTRVDENSPAHIVTDGAWHDESDPWACTSTMGKQVPQTNFFLLWR